MAKFNEILAGRFNRYLQRYLNMKGGPPAPTLSGDIQAQFEIESVPAEMRQLAGWKRFATGLGALPVAAQNVSARFRNPVGSNVIAVFEKIAFSLPAFGGGGVPGRVNWNTAAPGTDNPTTLGGLRFDFRQEAGAGLQANVFPTFGQNVAQFALTITTFWLGLNTPYDLIGGENQELSLSPGSTWEFSTIAGDGNGMFLAAIWRERLLEEGERVQ